MRTLVKSPRRTEGSVLMIAMAVIVVLGLGVASYLVLVRSKNALVARSQAWNTALAVAEAGIEEGMAQINVAFGTNYFSSAQTNWGGPGGGLYGPRSSTLPQGAYSAIILPGTPGPTIISTGTTLVPVLGQPITRTVKVTTKTDFAFGNAIAALQNVTMGGNGVTVDSYDSGDPNHCDANGNYDPATRKAGGDICSTSGVLNVGNANVFGHVRTAPWGTATAGANGRVGDLPVNWNGTGIEPGWWINDYNANFPDVTVPFTTGLPVVRNNGPGTNTFLLGTGNYMVNGDFTIANNETLYVSGNVRLYTTGQFNNQNGSYITIAPGATLQLYVGTLNGPAVTVNLTRINTSGNAATFQYYGLPSNTGVSWSGNASFVGTVYAPEADFALTGGGNTTTDFQGACVVKSITIGGHFNFHYDENLKRNGPLSGYTVSSWREL